MDSCETVCVLESFTEFDEVQTLINECINLNSNAFDEPTRLAVESIFETWVKIFDRYQEQPHLIDRYISSIISQLFVPIYNQAKSIDSTSPSISYHTSCNFIYHVSKVRGFKNLVRHLPHSVTDLEIVIDLLSKESITNLINWRTRYVLLLWSSLLVTLPFDFKKFDSADGRKPLMVRLYDLIKTNLVAGDTPRVAAAISCARFLTRPEISMVYLESHIDWCLNVIDEVFSNTICLNNRIGCLSSLAYIFKFGKREDISPFASKVLMKIGEQNILSQSKNLLVKMMMKINQRAGLSLLRVKIASWRYRRGRRSILDSLKGAPSTTVQIANFKIPENDETDEGDDNYLVPEEIEDVISVLLDGLRFNSNIVRWSAAKGVGRVTSRLPRSMAGEVVSSVCELLSPSENDGSWHGGCLALAELARRGLILPDQLKDIIPRIVKASVYEESRGNFSVGDTVRDAACYAFWAFARAYEAEILSPFLDEITSALLIVAVLDREIRCRRAASAAYQETVGRLGSQNVPHGIEILTTVDNQAVGRTRRAFIELSMFVAKFNNHLEPLILHILDKKINHWDQEIRCLSSEALSHLVQLAPLELIKEIVIPAILDKTLSNDLNTKHGSIICLAWVIHSIKQINIDCDAQVLPGIGRISQEIKTSLGFKGIKGELFRAAICLLIEKISLSKLPVDKLIQNCWIDILKDCVFHTNESIRAAAVSAFVSLYENYFPGDSSIEQIWIQHSISNCKSNLEYVRCGALEALGSLPKTIISQAIIKLILETILESLSSISIDESKWYAWKVASINCYTALLIQMDTDQITSLQDLVQKITHHTLNVAMEDYTTSSKGDVGEPVRIAAIISIKKIGLHFHKISCQLLTQELINRIMNQILIHCVSHHNEMRLAAGENFFELLYGLGKYFQLDDLINILPTQEDLGSVHLRDESNFPIWFKILSLTQYSQSLWKGLVMSTGGIPSSIVKLSLEALLNQLKSIKSKDEAKFKCVIDNFIDVYKDNLTVERMCLQLINTLNYLINSGILNDLEEMKVSSLIDKTWEMAKSTAIPKKKTATVQLLCGCLRFKGLQKKCLNILCIFLCTKYPFVRANAADELYTALLIYEDIFEEGVGKGDDHDDEDEEETKQEKALRLLTETDWNKDRTILIPIRDKLKSILGLQIVKV